MADIKTKWQELTRRNAREASDEESREHYGWHHFKEHFFDTGNPRYLSGFEIFAILIICSIIGYCIEMVFGRITNGYWESRQSLVYGPFGLAYGIGGLLPLSPSVEMTPNLNIFGMYDTQSFLIGLDLNLSGPNEDTRYTYGDFSISAYYAFGRKFIAPYIGGGLNYSGVDFRSDVSYVTSAREFDSSIGEYSTTSRKETETYKDSKSGIGAFIGGGFMFNRASNIVLFAETKYFVDFYKLTQPKDEVTQKQWNDHNYNGTALPTKSNKLFQGFLFNLNRIDACVSLQSPPFRSSRSRLAGVT